MRIDDVIEFWFSDRASKLWFNATPQFDTEILDRFEMYYQSALAGDLDHWRNSALGCLALVVVLDQFPLNMYRGRAESFAGEAAARAVSDYAIHHGYEADLPAPQKAFLFLPYMHSENMADQDRSVQLYAQHGLKENLKYAQHHRDIVRRFGRFPHRNAVLGRQNSAEETAYLQSKEGYHG